MKDLDRHALFLDVDGTLLPIAPTPTSVRVTNELRELLVALGEKFAGALALVSGRSIADLDGLFAPLKLHVAGIHGSERRRADGTIFRADVDTDKLQLARERLERWSRERPGILIEDKGAALAIHYRQAPELQDEVMQQAAALIDELQPAFRLQLGKCVCELRPAASSKAVAIESYLAESPFQSRIPIFVGDDVTDEEAFEWMNEQGGVSIKVGSGETAATYRLDDVDAVHRFLRELPGSLASLKAGA